MLGLATACHEHKASGLLLSKYCGRQTLGTLTKRLMGQLLLHGLGFQGGSSVLWAHTISTPAMLGSV